MATILADNLTELLSVLVLAFLKLLRIKLTSFSLTKLFPYLPISLSPYLPFFFSLSLLQTIYLKITWGVQRGVPSGKPFERSENMACSKAATINLF